jgi:hypothetical protein
LVSGELAPYNHLVPTVGRDRLAGRRSVSAVALTLATYALLLAAGSALHHDLVCQLKSRTQCTSCAAGTLDPGLTSARQTVEPDRAGGADVQLDAGRCPVARPFGPTPGRAPPA